MANTVYDSSIFKRYFEPNDAAAAAWASNVLTKLIASNVIPPYILREDEEGNPTDIADIYASLIKFLSYVVRLSREFEEFKDNDYLANKYLTDFGHYTAGDENLTRLAYLISNGLNRRAQRGTIKTIAPGADDNTPHGEILSLVGWEPGTFFKLGVARSKHNSWNVGNSSPAFRGCTGRYDLNIGYEYTESVEDINKYPLINQEYVSSAWYKGKKCMQIEGAPVEAGIGSTIDASKKITVDPSLNFEITFYVAQDITAENITFGVKAFDEFNNELNLTSVITGFGRNLFFETRRLNKAGKFYEVRGIIYSKDQSNMNRSDGTLDIGFGENLRFHSSTAAIIPYIVQDNSPSISSDSEADYFDSESMDFDSESYVDSDSDTGSDDGPYDWQPSIFLWNIKVTPSSLDYARTYLNNAFFTDVLVNNKNGKYTIDQIKDILRKYFIPYDTPFNITNFPRIIPQFVDLDYLLLETGFYILLESGDRIFLETQGGVGGPPAGTATYDDDSLAQYDDNTYAEYE